MVFKSSEIRWFSEDRGELWQFYKNLHKEGEGTREPDRTDYYLRTDTINTGIKIREGNHELKVKDAEDETLDYGVIEHWIKWSTSEEKNILNAVKDSLLDDWISVKKKRFKKTYEILKKNHIKMISDGYVAEGCGAEFTVIHLEDSETPVYTVGLEAFSSSNRERANLMTFIEQMDLDFSSFRIESSYGYPEFLKRYQAKSA